MRNTSMEFYRSVFLFSKKKSKKKKITHTLNLNDNDSMFLLNRPKSSQLNFKLWFLSHISIDAIQTAIDAKLFLCHIN